MATAAAAVAIALFAARPIATPGPFLRDFEAYWSGGSAWNAHQDPYGRAVWNAERTIPGVNTQRDEVLPFVGPPATLLSWSLFARLPYGVAASLWSAILVLALLALVACVLAASGEAIAPLSFLAMLLLAIACGPVTSDLALGQVALLSFLAAVAVTLFAESSLVLGVAAACAAFAQPNAALGLVSQLGRNRTTLAIAVAVVVTYAAGAISSNWAWPPEYARALAAHASSERFVAIQLTPASIAYGFGAAPRAAEGIALMFAALAIAAAIAIGLRVRDRFARFAAFAALAPFGAGFFHEHDLIVAFAAIGWTALRARETARSLALVGTLLVCIDWLGIAQRPTGLAQSCLLAVAALGAFAALGEERELPRSLLAAIPVGALIVVAASLALRHPAPIWPDALGSFHAPGAAPIADVWLAEQRAGGLLAAVPAWAFLRALSLLGCALLAYAIYRHSSCCRTA